MDSKPAKILDMDSSKIKILDVDSPQIARIILNNHMDSSDEVGAAVKSGRRLFDTLLLKMNEEHSAAGGKSSNPSFVKAVDAMELARYHLVSAFAQIHGKVDGVDFDTAVSSWEVETRSQAGRLKLKNDR